MKIPYCSLSLLILWFCLRVFSSYLFCILSSISSIMVRQNSSAWPCMGSVVSSPRTGLEAGDFLLLRLCISTADELVVTHRLWIVTSPWTTVQAEAAGGVASSLLRLPQGGYGYRHGGGQLHHHAPGPCLPWQCAAVRGQLPPCRDVARLARLQPTIYRTQPCEFGARSQRFIQHAAKVTVWRGSTSRRRCFTRRRLPSLSSFNAVREGVFAKITSYRRHLEAHCTCPELSRKVYFCSIIRQSLFHLVERLWSHFSCLHWNVGFPSCNMCSLVPSYWSVTLCQQIHLIFCPIHDI